MLPSVKSVLSLPIGGKRKRRAVKGILNNATSTHKLVSQIYVCNMFSWRVSPEGYKFWNKINRLQLKNYIYDDVV